MAAANGNRAKASIRTIWGIAKSPELALEESDLYAIIFRETGKEHMKQLTQGEISTVARVLQNMKDGIARDTKHKRTDEGGDVKTEARRRKIYALCEELGWNNDNTRVNGFVKRICQVDRIEWLTPAQCDKVIEGLKAMVARQKKKEVQDGSEENDTKGKTTQSSGKE